MILAPFQSDGVLHEAWVRHLRTVFDEMDIPSGPLAENVSQGLAAFCRRSRPRGVGAGELNLLIARSLCAVGEPALARRVLRSMPTHQRHAGRWLEVLSELHCFPELLPFFSRGVIRPADWAGAQVDRMWLLDLGRLSLDDSERHEMMLYRCVRSIIVQMACFWDATSGEGTLGLKIADASSLANENDLAVHIEGLFRLAAPERGWRTVPDVLNLDL